MAKNKSVTQHEEPEEHFEEFDFFDNIDEHGDETMTEIMNCLIAASRDQTAAAIDLTTLVIDASGSDTMNEEQVFAIYKRASSTIAETSPLKDMLKQFGA